MGRAWNCWFAAVMVVLAGVSPARAGGEEKSAVEFTKEFLQRYPRFHAEGVMTSTLAGRPPYRCRVEMTFDKTNSVLFQYNTDEAKNIIPYDFDYANGKLRETVYNRDRSEVVSSTDVGAPTRTIFNFVWDLLKEAENGVGLKSLLFNGLMSVHREDAGKGTRITLNRRIPAGPVEKVTFTFDAEERLRGIEIRQSAGDQHRIEIRRFRGEEQKPPPRH